MTAELTTTPLIPELYCSNFKTSVSFYMETLGFKLLYQREEDCFAMLEREGARIMLEELNTSSTRTWLTALMEPPFGRGINLQIKTLDVDQLYNDVKRAGVSVFLPMEEKWYRANDLETGHRQFIILDPDGYMLRFVQELGVRNIS